MNSPESLPELASIEGSPQVDDIQLAEPSNGQLPPEPNSSMEEYYQLQKELLILTLIFIGVIFIPIWIFYSLDIALNYLIGACTGVVYLKMLARNVEQLGRQKSKLSKAHLALFIGVIVVASQVEQLQILPIFLGFFTYKAALIFYMLRTLSLPKP